MSDPNTEQEEGAKVIRPYLVAPPVIPPQVRADDDVLFQGDQVMVTRGVVGMCGRCYAVRNIVSASMVERRSGPSYGLRFILWTMAFGFALVGVAGGGLPAMCLAIAAGIWAWRAPAGGARFSWELRLEMTDKQEVVCAIGNQLEAQAALEAVLQAMNHK